MRPAFPSKTLDIEGNVGLRLWGGDGRGLENDIVQVGVVVNWKSGWTDIDHKLVMCRKDDGRRDEAVAVQMNIIM